MKRDSKDWRKTIENYLFDKGFISRIYNKLSNLNSKKT